jgi:hypothetical protein
MNKDKAIEELFLGIKNGRYIGGRLENYTNEPNRITASVSSELNRMKRVINEQTWAEPFDLIPLLMKR